MGALHSKAVKFKTTVRESSCGSAVLIVLMIQTLFMQELTAVYKFLDDSGCESLVASRGCISECEVTTIGQLDSLIPRFHRKKRRCLQGMCDRWGSEQGPLNKCLLRFALVKQLSENKYCEIFCRWSLCS